MTPQEYAALSPNEREEVYRAATVDERRLLGFPRLSRLEPHPWDGRPLALWEFVRHFAPRWWHVWLLADGQCVSLFRDHSRVEAYVDRTWAHETESFRLLRLQSALDRRKRQVEFRRRKVLQDKLEPCIRRAVGHEWVIARSIDAGGGESSVPRRLASQLSADLMTSTLSASGHSWPAVAIELTEEGRAVALTQFPSSTTASPPPARPTPVEYANAIAKRVENDGRQMMKADMAKILAAEYSMSERKFNKIWREIGPAAWHEAGQGNRTRKKADPSNYYPPNQPKI